jgi:predicted RND superfamily exporter protein
VSRLIRFSSEHPRAALVLVAAITLLAVAGLVDPLTGKARLGVDPSFEKLLPHDDAGRRAHEEMQRRFGTGEWVVIALESPKSLLTLEGLETIARVEAELLTFDEVADVTSLASAALPVVAGEDLLAATALERAREHPDSLGSLGERLLGDPLYRGALISQDARLATLHVSLEPMGEAEWIESELGNRFAAAARLAAPEWQVWVAGAPFLKAEMARILNSELVSQVPLVLVIMMLASFVAFRTVTGSWLPVATILLALVWTGGAMGWLGHELNVVTSIVPPLILVVGFAYTIHVVAEAQAIARARARAGHRAGRDLPPLEAIAFPIALTAVTTAAGFLSLGASSHDAIREFGAFGAAGVLASLLAALTFTPAVLSLLPMRPPLGVDRSAREERWERALDRTFARLATFDLRHRRAIVAGAGVLFVGSLVSATWIEVDTRTVENFRSDSLVRQSYERLNEALGGSDLLYVMLEGREPGSLLEPARLREISELQRWLDAQPEIGGTASIVDHLEAGGRALGGPSPRSSEATRSLVAQLLWLADGDAVDAILDRNRQATIVQVRSRATSSREIGDLVGRIEARLAHLPPSLVGSVSGGSVLLTRAVDDVSRDQARSLVLAFGIIFAILVCAFRSPGRAALALLPNALPVVFYFGALGATGIPLNNATALLGCVVLGIAIDDTLHFVTRHRERVREGRLPGAAVADALADVGRPVSWTTAALCLGLLVLTTSELVTQAQFGALGAVTLLFAWAVDLVVTPALCSFIAWQPARAPAARAIEAPVGSGSAPTSAAFRLGNR